MMNRRDLLKSSSLALAGAALAGLSAPAAARVVRADGVPGAARRRIARLAHMTDTHIQPERRAFDGVTACLRHAMAQKDRPELVVTGGDLIMDSFDSPAARSRVQWDLWHKVFRDECGVPVQHCLGNHDVWGWNKRKSGTKGDEPQWGKRWAKDELGIASWYRAFDIGSGPGSWRCLLLDSTFPDGNGYIAKLGDEQMDWLSRELAATPAEKYVIVVSHMPILAACVLVYPDKNDKPRRDHTVPASWMHTDCRQIVDLFKASGKVKLCLSGHIHKLDRVEYQGVTYICDGAVSGAWWKGPRDHCQEGYGLVDLFDDGSIAHEYAAYGWRAETEE